MKLKEALVYYLKEDVFSAMLAGKQSYPGMLRYCIVRAFMLGDMSSDYAQTLRRYQRMLETSGKFTDELE